MEFKIGKRRIGPRDKVFVIPEIGINHEGDYKKAKRMVDDAASAGAECVKLQMHIIEDEMSGHAKNVIPGNAKESIWEIMERCQLTEEEHKRLKIHCEKKGLIYLCTPFSRAAADILEEMDVQAYKIGSGECNNYPLIKHITRFKKPVILSTGMNDINTVSRSVRILKNAKVPFAILHCTSIYPTPYKLVRLNSLTELNKKFTGAPIGLSDHSMGNYTCYGAVALGASILEKHFTSDIGWPGPDIPISITPEELHRLIIGANAIREALKGKKTILVEEKPTIDFAYASVVSIKPIKKGDAFNMDNIWVKRPGTGEILAGKFEDVLGKSAKIDIGKDVQIKRSMIDG